MKRSVIMQVGYQRTPTATSPASVNPTQSDGTEGGVTALPSTGQGQTPNGPTGMFLLLGLAMSLLLAAALLTRRSRRV